MSVRVGALLTYTMCGKEVSFEATTYALPRGTNYPFRSEVSAISAFLTISTSFYIQKIPCTSSVILTATNALSNITDANPVIRACSLRLFRTALGANMAEEFMVVLRKEAARRQERKVYIKVSWLTHTRSKLPANRIRLPLHSLRIKGAPRCMASPAKKNRKKLGITPTHASCVPTFSKFYSCPGISK